MKLSPFRIAAIYLLVALVWIATTDSILEIFISDVALLTSFQIAKGWFYVIMTATGLYFLIKMYDKEIREEKRKLERKDESLTLALESNKMATWEYFPDSDTYISSSNHHNFFDYPQSRDLSLPDVYKRIHPEDLEMFKDLVENTFRTKREFNVEYRIITSEGAIRWLWTRGIVYHSNGEIEKIAGITSDISESKTLKRKLDLEREKFETLFDQIPVLIVVFNPELNVTEVNREFENVLGWTEKDQQEKSLVELCYPDKEYRNEVMEFMEAPGSGWKELRVRAKSGEERIQLWSNIKLSDSRVVGIGHDITQRKAFELENLKDKDQLLEIFNNLPVLINIHDKHGKIIDFNDFVRERLGYSRENLVNGSYMQKLFPDDGQLDKAAKHMQRADHSWESFEVSTINGEVLKTSWMSMNLSKELKIGVGLDLTEIKELKDQLSMAVTGGKVGLWDYNPNTGEIVINEEWAKMIGYRKEELLPMTYEKWKELTHPEDVEETNRLLEEHFTGRLNSYDNEIRMKHKNGHWVWMLDRGGASERDARGNVARVTGTHIDITERKRLEEKIRESQARLKLATSSANVGLWEWNPQTGDVTIDEIWANLVGYTLEELEPVSIDTWNRLVHPDDLKRFEEKTEEYFSGKSKLYEIEVRMKHKDGHWVWILDRGKNVEWNEQGKPVKMIGTHVDITALKKKESQLRHNERLLQETQRVANLGTYTLNLETKTTQTSAILDQMCWLDPHEKLTPEIWEEYLHPDFKYISEKYGESIEQKKPFEAEYKIRNPEDKRERWIYEKAHVEFDKHGNATQMIGIMLDITRRKEQQMQVKRTLAQLKKAEEIAGIGYWEKNLRTGEVFWGSNKYLLYDHDPEDGPISRKELFQNIHPDDRKDIYDAYLLAEDKGDLDVTYRYKRPDGTYKTFREKAESIKEDSSGDIILRGVSIDITSLKAVESQLDDERKRLKIITGLVSDVVWEWNFEYETRSWSEGMETVFGYGLKDLPEGGASWTDRIHPEDKEWVVKSFQNSIEQEDHFWDEEYRFLDQAGDVRYVLDQGYIFRDESGKALKMVGAIIDQTAAKQSEEVLSSQARLLGDISDAVIATDPQRTITSWNRAAEMMYGWSEQEAIGKNIDKLLATKYYNTSETQLLEKLLEEEEWSGEVVQYNRVDEPMNILSSVRVLSGREGNVDGTVAVNKDITAIKQIRERLDYEQKRFEYATSVVSDAIWDAYPEEGTTWWSEGLQTHYKHPVPDPENGFEVWKNNLHPDDRDRVLQEMKDAEDSGASEWTSEYRFYRGDNTLATVLDRALILRDDDGEIIRIIGAMNDITLEREADKELKRSEQQYRLLYEQSPLPMWIYDKDTFQFLSVNEAAIGMYGYWEEEFLEMSVFDLFLPEERENIRQEAESNLRSHKSGFDVWRQKTKSGKILYCEISGSDIHFRDKQQRLVVSVDVTEQRKAEEVAIKAVVEGEERERHRIANELHDGLGQYLSAANMHLNTVYSDLENMDESNDRSFTRGLQMLEHAISETRSISHNLLPKAIQDYGLKLAVESLINELKSTQNFKFHLFQKYDDSFIPGNIQINVFRIIQEAVNNSIKHSGCSTININLVFSEDEFLCTIEDNGSGFDPDNIENEGLGLQSMKTRVAAMSGNIDIDTKQNSGTLITAIIPLGKN